MEEETTTPLNDQNNYTFKEEPKYAGFWLRVGAALIDLLVFLPIMAFGYYNMLVLKSIPMLYAVTVLTALYKPLMEWKYGATLGKMAVKLKVVNYDFKPINIDQAFTRYLPWAVSVIFSLMSTTVIYRASGFEYIDTWMEMNKVAQNPALNIASQIYNLVFLIVVGALIFDKKKRGIHDKMAKTYCIKIEKED